jgi:hypothetical protein
VKSACKGDQTEVTLKQERYIADAAKMAKGSGELWTIPVNLLPSATKKPEYHLLTKKEETVELPGCSAWVYANAGAKGYSERIRTGGLCQDGLRSGEHLLA